MYNWQSLCWTSVKYRKEEIMKKIKMPIRENNIEKNWIKFLSDTNMM